MFIINKLKLTLIIILSFSIFSLYASVNTAMAAVDCSSGNLSAQDAIQCGVNGASGSTTAPSAQQSTDSFNTLITTILNLLSVAVGIAAVVMIVFGGLKFITSGGNAEKVKSARSSIMYAIIGLVIVALAQVLVQFVLNKATGDAATGKGKCVATQFGYVWEGGPNKGKSCTP